MAKKSLKRPGLPDGPCLAFFLYLQDLVLHHGDLPVGKLAVKAGVSHQTVYKALTGPKLPSRATTEALTCAVAGQDAVATALARWEEAVADERRLKESGFLRNRSENSRFSEQPRDLPASSAREDLARRLKRAQRECQRKLEALGEDAGLSRSTAYAVVAGRTLPPWSVLSRFAAALEIDPGSIKQLYEGAVRERDDERRRRQ